MNHVLLLRGINLGARNRIAMGDLRAALSRAGFFEAQTYLQSGNVVLGSAMPVSQLARAAAEVIRKEFGLEISVLARTHKELALVIKRNPLPAATADPKRYLITFLERAPEPRLRDRLAAIAAKDEQLVLKGRELYSWHPAGVARSKLWNAIAGDLGVRSTSRNWSTVDALRELSSG